MKQQQSGAPEKLKVNKPSSLLTSEENEHIFSILGRRCQSMATAVVQLYITESPAHSLWIKRSTGIACFIRDSTKRSYFILIYCLLKNELIWEEEMYESIYINKSKEYLLDFEGRECLIALNFASESEANQFYKTAMNTISNRSKRRQDTNKFIALPPKMPPKRKATAKKAETSKEASSGVKKKTTAKGYQKSVPIPIGEIVTDIRKQQWKIGTSIGSGGFGEIYSACKVGESSEDYSYAVKFEPHDNGPLFFEKNVYMKLANLEDIVKFRKQRKLTTLGMPHYIGSGTFEFNDSKHRFLVIPRYGRDVWSFFLENGKKLPQPTVYRIAIQMLDVLEYIHQCNYIHADLKGANILLGYGNSGKSQVYLVDLGLASRFTKDYKPDKKKVHNGTIEYTSRDAHNGLITMRSDMEILAYNVIHWCGITLPWEADGLLAAPKKVQQSKEKFMSDVAASLKRCYPACPDVITSYLKYVTTLTVDATPDYQKCRKMFETALKQLGEKNAGELIFTLSPNVGEATQSKVNTTSTKKRVVRAQDKLLHETLTDDSDSEIENISPTKKASSLCKRVRTKKIDEVPAKRLKTTPTDELNHVRATKSTAQKSRAKSQQKTLDELESGDSTPGENEALSKKASASRKRVSVDVSKKASTKRLKTTSTNQVNDVVTTNEPLKKRAAKSQQKALDELEIGDSSLGENKSPSKKVSSSRKRVDVNKAKISNKVPANRKKTTPVANDVNGNQKQ